MRMLVRSNAVQIVSHNSELSENWNFHFIVAILFFVCRKAWTAVRNHCPAIEKRIGRSSLEFEFDGRKVPARMENRDNFTLPLGDSIKDSIIEVMYLAEGWILEFRDNLADFRKTVNFTDALH
jgi:hypothetical protein